MRSVLALAAVVLCSCGSPETLRIRQFHVKSTEVPDGHPFIRAEMNKRLYGAVTEAERNLRRGNYYHLRWQGLSGTAPVKVVFEYRQAMTGARVMSRTFLGDPSRKGERDIIVGGRDYLINGHVQSWRVRLYDGDRLVATEESYLWD